MLRALLLIFLVQGLSLGASFEAEDGKYEGGVSFANSIPGYSGRGYVTNFSSNFDQVTIVISVSTNGAYELKIGYHCSSDKGYDLQVNDEKTNGMFSSTGNSWGVNSGGMYLLPAGSSTIILGKGWGWFELDYVDVVPITISPPVPPPKILSDKLATASTKSLFSYLIDIYGKNVLSGQFDMSDIQYVKTLTGKLPAVGGFDLMDYSPSRVEHGANATGQVESEIAWALQYNTIITMVWHWNAPTDLIDQPGKEWWRGFYTFATTYDISYTLRNTSSVEYVKLIRDLDAIAIQLQKFQDQNTPLLWRPLHEAAGGWFWWGAKGPGPFKELWRLMYDRFVNYHKLHHLIWVFTDSGQTSSWYPGDDVVDVVGLDVYSDPTSSMSTQWEAIQDIFSRKKLVTLSETGNVPLPAKIRGLGVWWSWFANWSGMIRTQSPSTVKSVYDDYSILSQDRLPDWRHH